MKIGGTIDPMDLRGIEKHSHPKIKKEIFQIISLIMLIILQMI
jgi:hypothetical protein